MNMASGELWADSRGLFVRVGADFYGCSRHLVPRGAREFDIVRVSVDSQKKNVVEVLDHVPEEIIRRPKGFRPPTGVFVGKVTTYIPKRGGLIDHRIPFDANVVKAFGGGEASVGEIVEYSFDKMQRVSKVTGPFDTHVSKTGCRLH